MIRAYPSFSLYLDLAGVRSVNSYSKDEIEEFLFEETALQDAGDWEGWFDLWAPGDIELWIPVHPSETDRERGAAIIQDTRSLLEQRVKQLLHRKLHSQMPATRTSRIIGNVRVLPSVVQGGVRAAGQLHLVEFRPGRSEVHNGVQTLAGRVEYQLVRLGRALKIKSKKIELINSDGCLYNIQTLL
jgi:3-phenylpropionate/cinnamic acid dioxygenase small subunit